MRDGVYTGSTYGTYGRTHRARKTYVCGWCRNPINVGERYERLRVAPWYEFNPRPGRWSDHIGHISGLCLIHEETVPGPTFVAHSSPPTTQSGDIPC